MENQAKFVAAWYNAKVYSRLNHREIWKYTCILVFFLVLADGLHVGSEPLVNTNWGPIRGKWSKTVRGRAIANFLSIPYAQPPIGDLRFKSPQRWNRTWTTVRDATVHGQSCIQMDLEMNAFGSEDCLYLNIFVPMVSDKHEEFPKLPIFVVIYGGAFMSGSSKLHTPDYLVDHDIILVTFNYRLNILGFFSTANKVAPGNYGIKDIRMALKWIQENIHSFGGNPESVTVMGESAGGIAIHLLALSNRSEGLFHKYILHSGYATAVYSVHPRKLYRQICLELARGVGCLPKREGYVSESNETFNDSSEIEDERGGNIYGDLMNYSDDYDMAHDEEMVKCMRRTDVKKLVRMIKHFKIWRDNPLCIFGPVIEEDAEDAVLTMSPYTILKNGLQRDIPVIMSIVKDEGLIKSAALFNNPDVARELAENYEQYLPSFAELHDGIFNTSAFAAATDDFYFNGNFTLDSLQNLTKLLTNGIIWWSAHQALRYHSKAGNSSLYLSVFGYEGTFSITFRTGVTTHYGVCHGDDINYLLPVLNNEFHDQLLHNTESDFTMINIMTEMWANFAKEGVPKAWMIPEWPDYRDHHQFMRFGIGRSPDIVVQADFPLAEIEFWDKLLESVISEPVERDIFVDDPPEETMIANADTITRKILLSVTLVTVTLYLLF